MAHCCPSSSFGTSRRGWSFWWGRRRIRWWRVTKKTKTKSAKSEGERERGREDIGERVWRTRRNRSMRRRRRKEGTENERETREGPLCSSALSAVNGAHVADDLLSQALRLFTLRRDRSTARHSRGSPVVSPKDHAGPLKIDCGCGLSHAIFFSR